MQGQLELQVANFFKFSSTYITLSVASLVQLETALTPAIITVSGVHSRP